MTGGMERTDMEKKTSGKYRDKNREKKEKTEKTAGNLRRLIRWIFRKTGGKCPGRLEVEENLRLLSTDRSVGDRLESYYAEKTRLMIQVLIGGLAVSLLLFLTAGSQTLLTEGCLLPREERSYTRRLKLSTEDKSGENVMVEVEPRELTREESRELLEKAAANMESYILGTNTSLEEVRSDLNLVQKIEGTPIEVEWELDHYEALNLDGSLRLEKLKEEGSLTELTARLTCGEEEKIYRAAARVYPPLLTEEEQWEQSVNEAIAASQKESSQQAVKRLPEEIDGHPVSWEEVPSSQAGAALALTLFAVAAVYFGKDRELRKQALDRDRQMQRDYARIVSKLVLLMGAGAAIRNAWEMIVKDYQMKRDRGQIKLRYAYEEMALACHEMQSGVAEAKAYENFGIRCRLPCYLKLSALLEQNLRGGSKGLSQILNAEIGEAFEQRKDCALSQGEETSTRLLFPMVMMLAVVMLLILVPAVMSMQI